MTDQAFECDDEISLLDILVTLAESWKLLIYGPLIAGLLAGGVSFWGAKTYESVAIVRLSEQDLAVISTVNVLDALVEKFDLLPEFYGVRDDARQHILKKLLLRYDKKTGFATITAYASTPEGAQELAGATAEAAFKERLPKGNVRNLIEQQIYENELSIDRSSATLEHLSKQIGKSGQNDRRLEVVMNYYFVLTSEISKKRLENVELKNSMKTSGDEMYVQRPSLPQRSVPSKRGLFVLQVVLSSGLILLMYVFVRKAIASAAQDSEKSRKLGEIRVALGLREVAKKL